MARLSRDFADGESGRASQDQDELTIIAKGDSLSRHQQINARLQLEIIDVQDEVSKLKVELRQNQDPSKMTRIQAQIGVSHLPLTVNTGSTPRSGESKLTSNLAIDGSDQCNQRESCRG